MTQTKRVALVSPSIAQAPSGAVLEQWLRPSAASLSGVPALVPREVLPFFSHGPAIAYEGPLSMVWHAPLWRQLAGERPEEIHILGGSELSRDADALAMAAYLTQGRVVHHSRERGTMDLTKTAAKLRMDLGQERPQIRPLGEAEAKQTRAEINLRYINMVVRNGCLVPETVNTQESVRSVFGDIQGLAQDLCLRAPEISGNPWWVISERADGTLCETRDVRVAYARFLERLPDVSSALEVGCGSGFVTLLLGASPARKFERLEAGDLTDLRVEGAKLLGELSGVKASFRTMGADALTCPDKSFDVVLTCFVLEQCAEILDRALDECLRVARKFVVLFEPSMEAYPTLAGLIHIPANGYPTTYMQRLMQRGLGFSTIRPPLRQPYNPGALYVISVDSLVPPHIACPDLLHDIAMDAI